MVRKTLPSRDLVQQLLDYDPETGLFTWRPRPRAMFADNLRRCCAWNGKYAGTQAGNLNKLGYLRIAIDDSLFMAHRLAWLLHHGEPVPGVIDHVDRNPRNNSMANLRAATWSQNRANSPGNNNALGHKGVSKNYNRFGARIWENGKRVELGRFSTAEEAAEAYRNAAIRLYGDFARGN